jgi:hypothetical protein
VGPPDAEALAPKPRAYDVHVTARSPQRSLHQGAVDKTLILNNLRATRSDGKGTSYDASGKARAAATLTTAAEAAWSNLNQRGSNETKEEYHNRRRNAQRSTSQTAAPSERSVSLAPDKGKGEKDFPEKGKGKKGKSERKPHRGHRGPNAGRR